MFFRNKGGYGVERHFQQYFSYIVAIFITLIRILWLITNTKVYYDDLHIKRYSIQLEGPRIRKMCIHDQDIFHLSFFVTH